VILIRLLAPIVGGTLLLSAAVNTRAKGAQKIGLKVVLDDVTRLMSYHYYDGGNDGAPTLGLARLSYIDGWPRFNYSVC
jgi:hypothetical protein